MNDGVVLLVEDDPNDVLLAQEALRQSHLKNEIVVARDAQEALDWLFGRGRYAARDVSQQPALILLDLKLPGVGGLEVLRCIRTTEATRRLPVVILTTSREERDVVEAYNLGANSYVRKPVDFDQFVEASHKLSVYWLVLNEPPPEARSR